MGLDMGPLRKSSRRCSNSGVEADLNRLGRIDQNLSGALGRGSAPLRLPKSNGLQGKGTRNTKNGQGARESGQEGGGKRTESNDWGRAGF